LIDRDLWLVDATVIRAAHAAAGAKKNPGAPPRLGGPAAMQVQEPQDHALGCSQGGFGTKVHLVCDSHGIVLAVWVTPGQRHESQAFAVVLLRAKRPRRAGRPRWPRRVGADKGYSYPGIREWLRQHHVGGVIPTRKDQARDDSFDRAAYRRRRRIEQVVGWSKECRALGTRYEKLAVNYGALWMVAIIENLLKIYAKTLKTQLSDRA
jgi:transposase